MGMMDFLQRTRERRARDKVRFDHLDGDVCMLCQATGTDKRNLRIACLYDLSEVSPEFIDLADVYPETEHPGYYLRICKACRGAFLMAVQRWTEERIARRGRPMDHDGNDDEALEPLDANIPVRRHGTIVMLTMDEYSRYQATGEWPERLG